MVGPTRTTSRIGLALAGGGPEGAIYEIGALRALDEALEGVDLNDIEVTVGVSSGAFIGSCLVNDLSTAQMCRAIVKPEPGEHPFVPENFLAPAYGHLLASGARIPALLGSAIWDLLTHPTSRSPFDLVARVSRALPVGLFDNEPIRHYLSRIFSRPGRSDDFRRLRRTFVVVATDLDSGRQARFGEPGLDHVPISVAVQASSALPGLYPPVVIDGRHFVDGVLLKTVHASVAFEHGADLVLCINPIVPVDTVRSLEDGILDRGALIGRGLPAVLAQTFRTIIHSRMQVGIASYDTRYPDRDLLVFEPPREDYTLFFSNVFSFSNRRSVAERAYSITLDFLRQHRHRIEPVLARHGIRLRDEALEPGRDLWESVELNRRRRRSRSPLKVQLDRALERVEALVASYEAGQMGGTESGSPPGTPGLGKG